MKTSDLISILDRCHHALKTNPRFAENLAKDALVAHDALLSLSLEGVEPMAAISTIHLCQMGLGIVEGSIPFPGVITYGNEYGGFLQIGITPENLPQSLIDVFAWANAHDLNWVKFDGDATVVTTLNQYSEEWMAAEA